MERFHVRATHRDGLAVVFVAGEVTMCCARALAEALAQALAADLPVVVDCSEITFLDSGGLTILAEARLLAEKSHTSFRLAAVPEPVRQMTALGAAGASPLRQP